MINRRIFCALLLCTMLLIPLGAMAAQDNGQSSTDRPTPQKYLVGVYTLPQVTNNNNNGIGIESITGFQSDGPIGGGYEQHGAIWNVYQSKYHCYSYYTHPTSNHMAAMRNSTYQWIRGPYVSPNVWSHADWYFYANDTISYFVATFQL